MECASNKTQADKGLLSSWGPQTCRAIENCMGKTLFTKERKRQTQEWSTHIYTLPSLCLWPVRGTSGKSAPAKWSLMMLWPFVNCQSGHFPSIINAMDFTTALSATHPAIISELSLALYKNAIIIRIFSKVSRRMNLYECVFVFRRCCRPKSKDGSSV